MSEGRDRSSRTLVVLTYLAHLLAEAVQSNEFLQSVHVCSLGWQSTSLWSQKIDQGRIADSYARNP